MLIFCKYFSKLAKVLKLDNCYIWFHEKYVWHTLFHEFCQHHDFFPFWILCLLDHWAILSIVYRARSTHKLYFISKASFYTFFEKCDFDIQAQIAASTLNSKLVFLLMFFIIHSGKKLNIFYTCKYISSNKFTVYTLVHICNFTEFLVK